MALTDNWYITQQTPGQASYTVESADQIRMDLSPGANPNPVMELMHRRRFPPGFRFACEIKGSANPRVATAFFLYGEDVRTQKFHEIDVELYGNMEDPNNIYANIHVESGDFLTWKHGGRRRLARLRLGFDHSQAFHKYAFEWWPRKVTFFIDGEEAATLFDPDFVPDLPYIALFIKHVSYPWMGSLTANSSAWFRAIRVEPLMAEAHRESWIWC